MKTPSEDLINLIHSLTQAEKRYCRLTLQQKNLRNRDVKVQLLDTIYQNPDFNENQLTEWIASANYQSSITALKHQLKKQLLTALHHFYENQDDQARLYKDLHAAKILYQKGLVNACQSLLKSLKKEARQLEFHALLLDIADLEKQLSPVYSQFPRKLEHLETLYQAHENQLEKLRNENDFWITFNRLYQYHVRQTQMPFENEYPEVKALLQGEKPRFLSKPQTFKARLDYYQALALSAFMNGNIRQAFRFNRAFLRYFEANPRQGKRFGKRYLAIYNNYLIDGFTLGKYDRLEKGIHHLRTFDDKGALKDMPGIELEIFRLSAMLELNLYLARGEFQRGVAFSSEIKGALHNFRDHLPAESFITIHYLCAYFHFILGYYEQALEWILPILEDHQLSDVPVVNIFLHARMLSLIIHYELGNHDYLSYALANTQKQLKKDNGAEGVFLVTIRHLRKLIDLPEYAGFAQLWETYLEQLQTFDLQATIFDFKGWAKGHLEGNSMAEVMKH